VTPPLNSIDWASLKFGSILQFFYLQSETYSKRRSPLRPNFDSSVMDTTLSVGLQHASFNFTMCRSCHISYSRRIPLLPFRSQISRKDNAGVSCENSKIGNKSLPESRNVTMSHRLYLLPVTGNYMSYLITQIILKSSARKRCGYNSKLTEGIQRHTHRAWRLHKPNFIFSK
jgi:hypothetical protein